VNQAGLYPIQVEYFNGVEEGAIELSFAPGEVGVDAGAPVPSAFALVPLGDLYPPSALDAEDAGAPASAPEGGTDDASAGTEDASVGSASSGGSGEPPTGGSPLDDEHWHGGGCSLGANVASPGWLGGVVALLLATSLRRRRAS
jgi:MYXO-CTERM domain-containing protein